MRKCEPWSQGADERVSAVQCLRFAGFDVRGADLPVRQPVDDGAFDRPDERRDGRALYKFVANDLLVSPVGMGIIKIFEEEKKNTHTDEDIIKTFKNFIKQVKEEKCIWNIG